MPHMGRFLTGHPALCGRCRQKTIRTELVPDGENPRLMVHPECRNDPIPIPQVKPETLALPWSQPETTGGNPVVQTDAFSTETGLDWADTYTPNAPGYRGNA